MKKLIIAEKPSLARSIADAIGYSSFKRNDGYMESPDYVITWAFGHLFSLIDVEQYDPDYDPDADNYWTLENLPFYPKNFRFQLKEDKTGGVKKQFNIIKSLMTRKDVDVIVNAGDSDREGEIIVRLILMNAGNKKPVKRLWLPDQAPTTVRAALSSMDDDSKYDNLANEGFARTFIDWLYGINLTRYCTLKSRKLLRVGRVISEIVNAIYERDMAIKNFVPTDYYSAVSNEKIHEIEVKLTSKNEFDKDHESDVKDLCDKYNKADAIVSEFTKKEETINPGRLYSLSKLQGVLGKRYKISINEALELVQKLYEAGYVTYPRTNTEYLATAEKGRVKDIIKALSATYPVAFRDSKSIFDDSKIESHSAITPTVKIPKAGELSKKEQDVYDTIRNRFIAVFCSEPCKVNRSTIKIDVGGYEEFTITGDIMLSKGWTAYDKYEKKDKELPALKVGDKVPVNFKPELKSTKPPAHYTTDSLLKYLRNPFKEEKKEAKENEDEDYEAILNGLEIGTEATRAPIISNAINSGYILLKNDTYYIQELGIYYIDVLRALNITINKNNTIAISKTLKSIYKGSATIADGIKVTIDEINRIFNSTAAELPSAAADAIGAIGKCPVCGKPVKKNKSGYGCTGYKDGCKFFIASTIAGKKITEAQVKTLLEKGKTGVIKGFKSSAGKLFDAALKVENGAISFDFNTNNPSAKNLSVKCPKCGGELKADKWSWTCEKNCGFKINYVIAGKKITEKNAEELVKNGLTSEIKGFTSKAGKKFNAKLVLDIDKNIKFSFD